MSFDKRAEPSTVQYILLKKKERGNNIIFLKGKS